jgi:structural maintenance of chromosome 1
MGRLLGLELQNFKSYRGTVSVGFGSANFTSIIGPNGSGKSNMMDAISFVLGVRSSHLRSTQLKDLVYRGRVMDGNDEAVEGNDDPERAYVMAVYEKTDGEILELKRTITAAGQSEYRINNKVISAGEYSDILKGENILTKARNFLVFQGDVEQIASQTSTELAKLLEVVSGSVDYKREYELLKEQQDQAKEQTALVLSKRRTLLSEVKQYKEQSDEAELYKSKLAEKNELILFSTLSKLFHIDKNKDKVVESINQSKSKLKSLRDQITKENTDLKTIKTQYAKEALKLAKHQKIIDNKRTEINLKKKDMLPVTTNIEHANKKLTQLKKNRQQLAIDIDSQQSKVESLERNINTVKSAQKAATRELTKDAADISLEDQEEYQRLKQQFLSQGGAAEDEKLSFLANSKREIEAVLSNLEKQKSVSSEKVEELKVQQAEVKTQLTNVSRDLNELNERVAQKKAHIKDLNLKSEDFFTHEYQLQTKLRETLISLDDLSANQRETNRERQLRQNVATLKRVFPGVIGLLVDLVQPTNRQYGVALNTILGKHLDAIVVESSAVAHQCIQYLKEQRSGIASFIPLDIIEAKPIDSRLRHLDQGARPTIDVVEYEPYLERAVMFACGDSMICDDIKVAKLIRWGKGVDIKVVCLNGTLISKSNAMTAGYSQNQDRRWNKGEVQKLTELKDRLTHELEVLNHNRPDSIFINNQETELQSLQYDVDLVRRKRVELERSLMDIDAEIKYYDEDSDSKKKKDEQLRKLKQLGKSIAQQESVIQQLQSGIFDQFCLKLGFENIKEYEESTGTKLREHSRELRQYETELMKLKNKLTFEKERLEETQSRLERVSQEAQKYESNLKKHLKEKESIEDSLDRLESELEIAQEELSTFEKENESKATEIRNVEDALNDVLAQQESLKKEVELRMEEMDKLKSERISIFTNCNIENIQLNGLDFPIDTAVEVEVDYDGLPDDYKISDSQEVELDNRISEISKKLEELTPNVKAIERLQEVREKLSTLDNDLSVQRTKEMKIVRDFQSVKTKRYDLFMKAFQHISSHIDPIYKELTKAQLTTQLGGGSAYLTLEDEDEPYLAGVRYHAMPPMKRFKNMEFLSGGEKTIAALALLFAIHSFHPSPFFVLDEVDAALDNANVNKIANYITTHTSPEFQFIVISLKNALFERSDALVGIYRDQGENSSRTLTLDLRTYPEVA